MHDILPSTNPRSSIHRDNLRQTCGHCHTGMLAGPELGPIHVLSDEPEFAAVYYIRLAYIWLIVVTISLMVVHNGADMVRKVLTPPPPAPPAAAGSDQRLSPAFRLTHGLMMVSFLVLVVTGFALKFPETWWARPLLQWEADYGLRGMVHRVAGLAMMLALALHALHMIFSPTARRCIAGMLPDRRDLRALRQRLRYFSGRLPEPPASGPLSYVEKLEYLALLWGSLLMSGTGLLLWFENLTLAWMPAWATDVATVVHLYEAVLASLAVLVWHGYSVIFDPLVYPMDRAWLTGRSPAARVHERKEPPPPLREAAAPDDRTRFKRRQATP